MAVALWVPAHRNCHHLLVRSRGLGPCGPLSCSRPLSFEPPMRLCTFVTGPWDARARLGPQLGALTVCRANLRGGVRDLPSWGQCVPSTRLGTGHRFSRKWSWQACQLPGRCRCRREPCAVMCLQSRMGTPCRVRGCRAARGLVTSKCVRAPSSLVLMLCVARKTE